MPDTGIGGNVTANDESKDSLDFEEMVPWSAETIGEKLPDQIVFPEELNRFLRDRIRDLTAENGCLRRALEEVEEKVQRKPTDSSSQISVTLGKSSEMAAAKIIELSKKCRERTAEVEVLKSKCKSLEANLASAKAELENERYEGKRSRTDQSLDSHDIIQTIITNIMIEIQDSIIDKGIDSNQTKEDEDRVKHLTDRLQQVQTKLYESKNACATLKQDLNKAQKLLSSEVGENVSVTGLSSHPGGWRGRAEQIRLLQQKIAELQTRLSDYEGSRGGSTASMERKSLASIRNSEKERRQQIENSAKELRQAEVALESQKRKLDASKARIRVLENELNVAKGNVAILNEKRAHDDHLIEALNGRLKQAEVKYQEGKAEMRNKVEKIERECVSLKNELQAAQLQIDRLRRRLEEREIEIDKLRSGIVPNIESMRVQKILRTEVQGNEAQDDNSPRSLCGPSEYVTLALAAEAERERLLELVTVLNRRLDKERSDSDILSESLRKERSKSAKLELKLRKLETERVGIVKIDSGYKSKFLPKSIKANDEFLNMQQAQFKLELLEEECLALKTRLNTIQQDKVSDLARYKQMLDQVRKIFQEACRNKSPATNATRSIITI